MTQPQISDELYAVATEDPFTDEDLALAQEAINATGVDITPAQGVLLSRLVTLYRIRQDVATYGPAGGES